MVKWWQDRVAYQIYPRSFQDSPAPNGGPGDGIGDIPGIISRLDELRDLGIGILWLSPVYRSPGVDNGYDIADYCSIDPIFGTMTDMERLIAGAGKRDIRIIMDLVINHTSDEHKWFQKSRDRDSSYRNYYIWRPPRRGKSPLPNNWTGFFMENVWEFDPQSGEYYLHLFHKKQPDLNYKNPAVIEEIKKILRFWLDKGIAGFRCDVINIIYKASLDNGRKSIAVQGIEHYKCREGNHAVLRKLRRDVLDEYDCFTVGETVMVDLPEAKLLCDESRKELDMLFYFEHLEIDRRIARFIPKKFRARKLLEVLTKWQQGLEWNAVYLENHDQARIVSHFGDPGTGPEPGRYWEQSAKLLALLELTLRGTPFIYQGQEIGMTNFDFKSIDQVQDVESRNVDALMKKLHIPRFLRWKWVRASSRDNARTPFQWSAAAGAGFTQGVSWLGINRNYRSINYEAQKGNPASVFGFYKQLIRLRSSSELLKRGAFEPLFARGSLMAYERRLGGAACRVFLNFSRRTIKPPKEWTEKSRWKLWISNTGRTDLSGKILPWEAVLISRENTLV
jgi:oligo-1,6-glucosidase